MGVYTFRMRSISSAWYFVEADNLSAAHAKWLQRLKEGVEPDNVREDDSDVTDVFDEHGNDVTDRLDAMLVEEEGEEDF